MQTHLRLVDRLILASGATSSDALRLWLFTVGVLFGSSSAQIHRQGAGEKLRATYIVITISFPLRATDRAFSTNVHHLSRRRRTLGRWNLRFALQSNVPNDVPAADDVHAAVDRQIDAKRPSRLAIASVISGSSSSSSVKYRNGLQQYGAELRGVGENGRVHRDQVSLAGDFVIGVDGEFVLWLRLVVIVVFCVGIGVRVWRWGSVVHGSVGLLDMLDEGGGGLAGAVGHGFVCDLLGDWGHWSEE